MKKKGKGVEMVPKGLTQKIDTKIEGWKEVRKGTQVHLAQIRPWIELSKGVYLAP